MLESIKGRSVWDNYWDRLIRDEHELWTAFNYIHQNPTEARLTDKDEDWEFSSAKDYSGLRNGKLINKELAKEYVMF